MIRCPKLTLLNAVLVGLAVLLLLGGNALNAVLVVVLQWCAVLGLCAVCTRISIAAHIIWL